MCHGPIIFTGNITGMPRIFRTFIFTGPSTDKRFEHKDMCLYNSTGTDFLILVCVFFFNDSFSFCKLNRIFSLAATLNVVLV